MAKILRRISSLLIRGYFFGVKMSDSERRLLDVPRDGSGMSTPQVSRPPTPASSFSSRPGTPTARSDF